MPGCTTSRRAELAPQLSIHVLQEDFRRAELAPLPCLYKEKLTKRKHARMAGPHRQALRMRSDAGNFTKAYPWAIEKQRTSGALPCGFLPAAVVLANGSWQSKCQSQSQSQSQSYQLDSVSRRLLLLGPVRRGLAVGCEPEGRHTGRVPFFDGAWMRRRKMPDGGTYPQRAARRARCPGVLSLGYVFFAQAKKSNSPDRAKAFVVEKTEVPA